MKNDPQVTPVDTWRLWADADGDAPIAEFPDLLHLNDAGYARWAATLRPVLESLDVLAPVTSPFTVEPGFEPLFNGRDLTGWGYRATTEQEKVSAAKWQASDPNAAVWPFVTEPVSFDGRTTSLDGRWRVIGDHIAAITPAEYRKVSQLWTTKGFEGDFVLKLEFRATPYADGGVFLRGPQLQVRDYRLSGPYTSLASYRPQDWNELVVTVKGETAEVTCNGEVIEKAFKVPAIRWHRPRGRSRPDGIPPDPPVATLRLPCPLTLRRRSRHGTWSCCPTAPATAPPSCRRPTSGACTRRWT